MCGALCELYSEEGGRGWIEARAVWRRKTVSVGAVHRTAPHCNLIEITANASRLDALKMPLDEVHDTRLLRTTGKGRQSAGHNSCADRIQVCISPVYEAPAGLVIWTGRVFRCLI